jgi:hypothetical protein
MNREDIETNRDIRKVLVRHWIDLGQLSIRSNSGRVVIRGALRRIEGFNEALTSAIVDRMFGEINRIPSVGRAAVDLTNWSNQGGSWRSMDDSKVKKPHAGQAEEQSHAVFDAERPPPTG